MKLKVKGGGQMIGKNTGETNGRITGNRLADNKRTRHLLAGAAAAVLALTFAGGCGDEPLAPKTSPYLEPTSPANVIANLAEAYRRKDITEYASLLAPEYLFYFQPQDLYLIEGDYWTRDQDSTGTAGLFGTPLVGDIRIDLPHGAAQKPGVTGYDDDVLYVRISPVQLQVDQVSGQNAGITLQVDGDYEDMYFRPGRVEAGEDTTHWFLVEWRDIPSPIILGSKATSAAIEAITWGKIKTLFR